MMQSHMKSPLIMIPRRHRYTLDREPKGYYGERLLKRVGYSLACLHTLLGKGNHEKSINHQYQEKTT